MTQVLFVCAGNICRSPLAAALLARALRARSRHGIAVASAGLVAIENDVAIEATRAAGRRVGVDLSGHRARRFHAALVGPGDLVLVMEKSQRDEVLAASGLAPQAVRLLGSLLPGPEEIADPGGQDEAAFTFCAERIAACVERLAIELGDQDRS